MQKKDSAKNDESPKVISVLLQIGDWKTLVPDERRRLLIAIALNHCVNNNDLNIVGYLITSSEVYLLLRNKSVDYKEIMVHFNEFLIIEIARYLKTPDFNAQISEKRILFSSHELYNENLKKLITGRKAEIDFYTPQLLRLQNTIKYNIYCSAIDYSGGKSAVILSINNSELKI